jgi:acyl-CoA synthetase (AMP-forming)/AMP-acid ligase II
MMSNNRLLTDRLDLHASEIPDRVAYTFLGEQWPTDASTTVSLTFVELSVKVESLAAHLLTRAKPGDRAALLYPSGLDFVVAFLACLRAGIIAVPVNVPRREKHFGRLINILKDCEPLLTLTTQDVGGLIDSMSLDRLCLGQILATDDHFNSDVDARQDFPFIAPKDIAFLQYTSGSTAEPQGVVVTHANLLANEAAIEAGVGHTRESVHVGWLPLFHDMGLVGNVLQPLYVGYHSILMSPDSFLREPVRWLRAINDFRGTTSGAPNFAYEHCARLVTAEEKRGLDLSSWRVAFNGAEPVRAATLDRFSEAFGECGFQREAWCPCYGIAECTLFVSGGPPMQLPRIVKLSADALEQGRAIPAAGTCINARPIVACGRVASGIEVRIVDPETDRECAPGQVGMIWIRGDSVTSGYWNQPERTRAAFAARLNDTGDGPYLRTGDLGFVLDDQVFITGRLKELIIINGRNIYPQDVEAAPIGAHPLCRPGTAASFGVSSADSESLVVIVEVEGTPDDELAAEIRLRIRQSVMRTVDVMPNDIELVPRGSLSKTSSGKLRRVQIRDSWLEKNSRARSEGTRVPFAKVIGERMAP